MCSIPAAQTLCRHGRGDRTSLASGHKHCKDTELSHYIAPSENFCQFPKYFYLEVKYSQSFFIIKRIYPLKNVNFWHGCLTVAVNIFDDLQSHSCVTSANKSTLGMLTCIFVNLNEPSLISDSECSLYMKPILCIYVYMSIYVLRTNFSVCTVPQPLHSELEKVTVSIIDIFDLVTCLKGKLINMSDIGLCDMDKNK